jgi:hypothetical protein
MFLLLRCDSAVGAFVELPLFRMKDDRPGPAMLVYRPCSAPCSRRRWTQIYEHV